MPLTLLRPIETRRTFCPIHFGFIHTSRIVPWHRIRVCEWCRREKEDR